MEENPYKAPAQLDRQDGPSATRLPLWIIIVLLGWIGVCLFPVIVLAYLERHFAAPLGGLLIEVLCYGPPLVAMVVGSGVLVWLCKKAEPFLAPRPPA